MGRPKKATEERMMEWFTNLSAEKRSILFRKLEIIDKALLRREQQEAEGVTPPAAT